MIKSQASLRGMSKANDEAIYNINKEKYHNGILKVWNCKVNVC
ncbi:hypothetical protein [Helicobacter rodentium]|nr:hypothetical protein [Helicobacter rodentium]